ncbi:MAG TPA: hypothetical protein VNI01_09225, partial [Elusimicrobiota bacterium]|nr:hypothetical protein [Elusimicrobiota bacterium]
MKPRRIEALWMAAALAAAAPMLAMPIGDPDLWWHLSAARRMLDTWSFPRADWLSFTRAGAPWVDFEWLSQLALGGAWGAGRMAGLLALKIALLLWAGWWLERGMRARGVRAPERAAALALCAAAMIPRSDARTELFSFVFFAALTRRDEAPRPAPAAGLFALWANLHAGFAYGLLFLGALAAGRLWEAFGPARRRTAMGEARSALAALGAAVAGTLANPYGWGVYRVLARHAREVGSLPGLIAEWGPLSLRRPPHWPAWAALACAVWVLTRPGPAARRPRPGRLLCLALLGLAAWRHSRAAPYFCLLAAPWCVPELLAGAGAPAALRSAGAAAFLAAGAGLGLKLALPLGAFRAAWHAGYLPLESAAYLARRPELARRNVYNPWGWGGYLGFRLAPDLRVFQDGRYI